MYRDTEVFFFFFYKFHKVLVNESRKPTKLKKPFISSQTETFKKRNGMIEEIFVKPQILVCGRVQEISVGLFQMTLFF
jgi:hypothetical protein